MNLPKSSVRIPTTRTYAHSSHTHDLLLPFVYHLWPLMSIFQLIPSCGNSHAWCLGRSRCHYYLGLRSFKLVQRIILAMKLRVRVHVWFGKIQPCTVLGEGIFDLGEGLILGWSAPVCLIGARATRGFRLNWKHIVDSVDLGANMLKEFRQGGKTASNDTGWKLCWAP